MHLWNEKGDVRLFAIGEADKLRSDGGVIKKTKLIRPDRSLLANTRMIIKRIIGTQVRGRQNEINTPAALATKDIVLETNEVIGT